jgi:Pyridoxamine 5'-phosphate oxidase
MRMHADQVDVTVAAARRHQPLHDGERPIRDPRGARPMSSAASAGQPSMTPKTSLDERFSDPGAEAVAWPATQQVIENAELFWVTTVRPDGRPHSTPLVAVWLDDALHFCTGETEQKAHNLAANHHGDGGEALVFRVEPTKVLAFGKGTFSHTRHRF